MVHKRGGLFSEVVVRWVSTVPNYSCIILDRSWSENNVSIKKGGGLCCYIKNDMIYSENELKNHNTPNRNIEMQIILINQPHLKKIVLVNLYRPPQSNTTEFRDKLSDTIASINAIINKDFELFIYGDFNIINPTSPGYLRILNGLSRDWVYSK